MMQALFTAGWPKLLEQHRKTRIRLQPEGAELSKADRLSCIIQASLLSLLFLADLQEAALALNKCMLDRTGLTGVE